MNMLMRTLSNCAITFTPEELAAAHRASLRTQIGSRCPADLDPANDPTEGWCSRLADVGLVAACPAWVLPAGLIASVCDLALFAADNDTRRQHGMYQSFHLEHTALAEHLAMQGVSMYVRVAFRDAVKHLVFANIALPEGLCGEGEFTRLVQFLQDKGWRVGVENAGASGGASLQFAGWCQRHADTPEPPALEAVRSGVTWLAKVTPRKLTAAHYLAEE